MSNENDQSDVAVSEHPKEVSRPEFHTQLLYQGGNVHVAVGHPVSGPAIGSPMVRVYTATRFGVPEGAMTLPDAVMLRELLDAAIRAAIEAVAVAPRASESSGG